MQNEESDRRATAGTTVAALAAPNATLSRAKSQGSCRTLDATNKLSPMLVSGAVYIVYRFFLKHKDREWVWLIPFVCISLSFGFGHFFKVMRSPEGFPTSDDSKWYLDYAYAMLDDLQVGLHMNDIMYFGYNMLLTLLLAVFKSPTAVLVIQTAAAGLSVILVYKIARMMFNRTTAVFASLLYSVSEGKYRWTVYILNQSAAFKCLFAAQSFETGRTKYKVCFALHTRIARSITRYSGSSSDCLDHFLPVCLQTLAEISTFPRSFHWASPRESPLASERYLKPLNQVNVRSRAPRDPQ